MAKTKSDYFYLIITIYNVGLYDNKSIKISAEEWMVHRFQLFVNYCLPSILNQNCKDFTWLVLFDDKTPSSHLDKILPLLSDKNIIYKFIGSKKSRCNIKDIILESAPKNYHFLATQQHDNDDFLAINHVKKINAALKKCDDLPCVMDTELIYIIKEENMKFEIVDIKQRQHDLGYATPFCIVVEKRHKAITRVHTGHENLRQHVFRYLIVDGLRCGRVVHENNLAPKNRKSGVVITEDTILRLTDQFKINPKRIMNLWQSSR